MPVLTELLGLGPFMARFPGILAAATMTWWFNRSWTFEPSAKEAVLRGEERNWDLLNDELYAPYAWLEG